MLRNLLQEIDNKVTGNKVYSDNVRQNKQLLKSYQKTVGNAFIRKENHNKMAPVIQGKRQKKTLQKQGTKGFPLIVFLVFSCQILITYLTFTGPEIVQLSFLLLHANVAESMTFYYDVGQKVSCNKHSSFDIEPSILFVRANRYILNIFQFLVETQRIAVTKHA